MKNKKILNMGVIIATIAPLAMVVSCGSGKTKEQGNLKEVKTLIDKAITTKGAISIVDNNKPTLDTVLIKLGFSGKDDTKFKGLKIKVDNLSSIEQNKMLSIEFNISDSKGKSIDSSPINITWSITPKLLLSENKKKVEASLAVHKNLTFTGGTSITSNHLKILLGLDKKIDNSIKLSCVKIITKGKSISHTEIQLSIGSSHVQTTKTINVIWNKKVFIDSMFGFSQKIDNTHYLIGTRNGVYQIAIDKEGKIFSSILYAKGIDKNKIPSCKGGFSQKIDDTHYLIGTENKGVYQVELNKDTKLIKKTIAVSMWEGTKSIPDVMSGFSQKIDDTHYLIGTGYKGVYQVELDKDTKSIKKTTQVKMTGPNSIPSVNDGFSQKIDDTHFLIGTKNKGVYQVELDEDTKSIKTTTAIPMLGPNSIPLVRGGFSQKIDDTHYLISTYEKGVYQVELNKDTKLIKKTTQVKMTGPNSIPDVMGGFFQKIDDTHYLIGTGDNGIYQVELDKDTKSIKKTTQVKMTGPNSIPDVYGGFAQKIDDTHYLIGTIRNGVYQIVVGKYGMITKIEQYYVKPKL